jgi:poly [ADP-ribose] polymerase 2/3/4
VEALINLIFDTKVIQQQVKEIGYDANKTPLGALSKESVTLGYKILQEISDALITKPAKLK